MECQSQPDPFVHLKAVGYLSFIFPVVTIDKNNTVTNFTHSTTIGFPTGVNLLYSESFGFSFEFTPIIRSGSGTSKVSNLLFHPGTMFRFKNGFTVISRLAFETSGTVWFHSCIQQSISKNEGS